MSKHIPPGLQVLLVFILIAAALCKCCWMCHQKEKARERAERGRARRGRHSWIAGGGADAEAGRGLQSEGTDRVRPARSPPPPTAPSAPPAVLMPPVAPSASPAVLAPLMPSAPSLETPPPSYSEVMFRAGPS